jgi:hypothetical protein
MKNMNESDERTILHACEKVERLNNDFHCTEHLHPTTLGTRVSENATISSIPLQLVNPLVGKIYQLHPRPGKTDDDGNEVRKALRKDAGLPLQMLCCCRRHRGVIDPRLLIRETSSYARSLTSTDDI